MAASQKYYDRIAFYTARLAELDALNSALAKALEPLAALELPEQREGNAAFYSLLHADIERAKAILLRCPRELTMQPIGGK